LHPFGQFLRAPDHVESDFVFKQVFEVALQEQFEEVHQRLDFVGRALPIFHREGKECQVFEVGIPCGLHDFADIVHATAVPLNPGQTTLARPSAITIHDNGHVTQGCGAALIHLIAKGEKRLRFRSTSAGVNDSTCHLCRGNATQKRIEPHSRPRNFGWCGIGEQNGSTE